MKNFMYHNQIVHHELCFYLFILHYNQRSEKNKKDIFCTFPHTAFYENFLPTLLYSLYIYIYIYVYIYIYICIYIHVYICICIYIYIYTYINNKYLDIDIDIDVHKQMESILKYY